nr:hypothetical protein [Streptomyces californicus]
MVTWSGDALTTLKPTTWLRMYAPDGMGAPGFRPISREIALPLSIDPSSTRSAAASDWSSFAT